jgi:rubrerythrin
MEQPLQGLSPNRERDEIYALVSVMYHALQGAEAYGEYMRDAEQAGDEELADFFEGCCEEETERAQRAKRLLGARIGESEDEDFDDELGEKQRDDEED